MAMGGFIPYSLGIVAEDSNPDSRYITIYPVEKYPAVDGDVNAVTALQTTNKNIDGGYTTTTAVKSYTIKAKWLAIGEPNRLYAPNVCKGESVQIYKFGDSDKYFWSATGAELDIRKNEKAFFLFSNTSNIEARPDDSFYFVAFNTIDKYVRIHTSTSDGEPYGYDIDINTKDGVLTIQDTNDNSIVLDSGASDLTVTTNETVNVVTKNENHTIEEKLNITLKKLAISNGSNELISVLVDLVDAMLQEQHIGNLGRPTTLEPSTISAYNSIKARLSSFK